jgi:hypothetical protein
MYLRQGETQCPADYPERFDFFSALEDTRSCSPCECTETAPAQCEATFSSYQDQTCGQVLLSTVVDLGNTGCIPILSASAELGSMAAEWVANEPGTCIASGGEPVGAVVPIDPRIFCCQPPPGM